MFSKSEESLASLCSRWLDKLGLSARMGIEVVMRQVLFGAGNYHLVDENFEPLPVSDHYFPVIVSQLKSTFYEESILLLNSVLLVSSQTRELLSSRGTGRNRRRNPL